MSEEAAKTILERLTSGYSLPPLSVVATKLIELASNDKTSINDLTDLIEKDPSLTTRLLSLANTAFFRTSTPVTSIEQAILKIGFNRLRIMALSLSLRDTFPMGRRGPIDYEKFWKVSLYKALLSKSLAVQLRNSNPDEAFVAGLIQEVGLLILFDLLVKGKDETVQLELYPLEPLLTFEKERFGIDHRDIGEAALRYWQFPESIIACQHLPGKGDIRKDTPLCLNCDMAGKLSSMIFQKSMELGDLFIDINNEYGLTHEFVSDTMIAIFCEVEEIADSFRVEVNREKDLLEIMEKANRVLASLSEQLSRDPHPASVMPSFQSLNTVKSSDAVQHTLQSVAHEIRNPLVSVGGFVKKLSTMLDASSQGWEYVQIILEETKKLEQALSRITGNDEKLP
jgi:two-component system, cell cycle response regulator